MISLSVVIITYNEERNIARCLESVKEVADEIVVLDSFSKDKTEKICRDAGVKFFQHAFDGHIEQKNRAITYASNRYVLSLDADEALSEELRKSILEAKKNWIAEGYYMNRLTNYCGQWIHHCGWYPDSKMRLFDSTKGKWGGTNPHDKYELTVGDKSSSLLKGDLFHYSFYTIEEHSKRALHFSDISAKEMAKAGKNGSYIKLYGGPLFKFIQSYFFRLGFLDGYYGLVICLISARAVYQKQIHLFDYVKGGLQ